MYILHVFIIIITIHFFSVEIIKNGLISINSAIGGTWGLPSSGVFHYFFFFLPFFNFFDGSRIVPLSSLKSELKLI
jgi:hypothetical protein